MLNLPIINVKTDPLDALLYGLGLRLAHLSKHKTNADFNQLISDKEVAIQFVSGDVARYYRFVDGYFGQASGRAKTADLTIEFADSLTGAKLLSQGNVANFMTAIQSGDAKITGDYKLVLWFANVAKQAVAVPENYKNYLNQAKPYLNQVKPYAQQAYQAAQGLLNKIKTK